VVPDIFVTYFRNYFRYFFEFSEKFDSTRFLIEYSIIISERIALSHGINQDGVGT